MSIVKEPNAMTDRGGSVVVCGLDPSTTPSTTNYVLYKAGGGWNGSTEPGDAGGEHERPILRWPLRSAGNANAALTETEVSTDFSAFLARVYSLAKWQRDDDAIDVIFDHINDLLVNGQFTACEQILREIDIARIPPVLMVSFLTITAPARAVLRNREAFYKMVRRSLAKRGEEAADRLLDGLE